MNIRLPTELHHESLTALANEYYVLSFATGNTEVSFHWTLTEWAALPEILFVLLWSSKLVTNATSVEWRFADPRLIDPDLDTLRFQADLALGPNRYRELRYRLDTLRRKALARDLTAT